MTPEELQQEVTQLKRDVADIKNKQDLTYRQSLRLTNAIQGSRVYFVANSSGGSLATQLTFKDGILTLVESPSVSPSPSISPSSSPSKSPSVSPSVSPS